MKTKHLVKFLLILCVAGTVVWGARKMAPFVNPSDCVGCSDCVQICPVQDKGAIEMLNGKAVIDPEICISCGLCVSICSFNAVRY